MDDFHVDIPDKFRDEFADILGEPSSVNYDDFKPNSPMEKWAKKQLRKKKKKNRNYDKFADDE